MKIKECAKILVVACFSLVGCIYDQFNHQLSLTNTSKRTLSYLYTNFADRKDLTGNNVAAYIADWMIVKSDSTEYIAKPGGKNIWHNYIANGKNKKLYVYLFDTDTLKKYNGIYSMEDIVNQHKYLKLLSYSESDLNKINWQVVYKD